MGFSYRLWRFFKDSSHIAVKDLKDFIRDHARIISFLIMPIFMMLLTGFIFPSQSSLKNIPIGLLDQDGGTESAKIIDMLNSYTPEGSSTPIMVLKPVTTEDQVKKRIREQTLSGAIIFPAGFSEGLEAGQQQTVIIVTDQSNPQVSQLMSGKMQELFSEKSAEQSMQTIQEKFQQYTGIELASDQVSALITPVKVETEDIVPGKPNYFQFVAPGVMAMVIMMAVMMGLAGSITREKEQGTLDGLLVSPVSRGAIIMGKTEAQSVRGLAQGSIILVLAMTVFGVKVHGSFLLVVLILILGILSFVGLGILVSASVQEQETAMTINMTITFPMMFLSGAFFPCSRCPAPCRPSPRSSRSLTRWRPCGR